MPLVYAGVCSHAPGITGRKHLVDQASLSIRDEFYKKFDEMRQQIESTRPDAMVVVAAEHFANFFMDNMPAFCMGMADFYDGPIEDEKWLGIAKTRIPGNPELSLRLIKSIMQEVDLAYAQEWKFDHGIIVPLHFLTPKYNLPVIPVNINCQGPPLTPLHRAKIFGEVLRRTFDEVPERIALIGTGGISHWPCTPDSGKINHDWDARFLNQFLNHDLKGMTSYSDEETYTEAGQGGFEIRTFITVSAAANGPGDWHYYTAELPVFAVGCTLARLMIN
ncbi:MAG: extradiol ring-cleavage dioxygenase [SAR324 cluster bacterium]|nr:extradiol ring-cleavage dioxygenase [SAR324 cluster bacterium]